MRTSRQRFLIVFAAALAVLCVASALRVNMRVEQAWSQNRDQLLRDKVVILTRAIVPGELSQAYESVAELQAQDFPLIYQVFDGAGKFVRQHPAAREPLPLSETTRKRATDARAPVLETQRHPQLGRLRIATCARLKNERSNSGLDSPVIEAFLQVILPMDQHHAAARIRFYQILSGSLIYSGIVMAAAIWASSHWMAGLKQLTTTARQLSQEELPKQRLPTSSKEPELAEFARVCNAMLDRLEKAYASRQQFIADAAHELRTPLTILHGEIDVALRREREPERYRQVLASNREEIERLSRLVENFLLLARADAGKVVSTREPVNLHVVCLAVADKLSPLAGQGRVSLKVEGEQTVEALGDRLALERVIFNLVENAIRYSPADEAVTVRVSATETDAAIEVSDTGRGIPPESLPHVFERFYRVDPSRSRHLGGAGLGLAIVKALVEAQGGKVTVQSIVGQGSTFTVRLPRPQDGSPK